MRSLTPNDALLELSKKYISTGSRAALASIMEQSKLNESEPAFSVSLSAPKKEAINQDNKTKLREHLKVWHDWEIRHVSEHIDIKRVRRGSNSVTPANYPSKLIVTGFKHLCELLDESMLYDRYQAREKILSDAFVLATEIQRATLSKIIVLFIDVDDSEFDKIMRVLPQLKPGGGRGLYLRQLPLKGVDTKFLETSKHASFIHSILQLFHADERGMNGEAPKNISEFLWVKEKPAANLRVRFSPQYQSHYANLSTCKMDARDLMHMNALESNVLIVENETCVFEVSEVDDLLIIGGAGYSLNFLAASWLQDKKVAYWGDMDSDGLNMMQQVLSVLPHASILMMDETTYQRHQDESVIDPNFNKFNDEFQSAYVQRMGEAAAGYRLEQEYLPNDLVNNVIKDWLS